MTTKAKKKPIKKVKKPNKMAKTNIADAGYI